VLVLRRARELAPVEAVAFAIAAGAIGVLLALLPEARPLEALACLRLFLAPGACAPWQNLANEAYRTTPERFTAKTQEMVDKHRVREEVGLNNEKMLAERDRSPVARWNLARDAL
jgi:hypothetical protein